ncbi:hypothetical protein QRD43_08920 [Pelomonas sp. APW6]|uniref:Uncharacterized protein n=1 Tax=Roseateles subflavus TaxID=3053353 RepID=A0ABT7LGP9_9BURK|nr:hypothetical protein [Pelomonas sp. APW6]MDL5032029.1 hypothetical protein [Pelomonas sp. APW6]
MRKLLLPLFVAVSTHASADVLPPPIGYKPPPPRQTLAVEVQARMGTVQSLPMQLRFPVSGTWPNPERSSTTWPLSNGGCLSLILHDFRDGTVRPTGQLLDESCNAPLGDWLELRADGKPTQFSAMVGVDVLEIQVFVRWVDLNGEGLSALARAELQEEPQLTPAQLQLQLQQRQSLAYRIQMEATDRAWRATRRR